MARMIFPNGSEEWDLDTLASLLAELGVSLHYLPLPEDPGTQALLAPAAPGQAARQRLLHQAAGLLAQWLPEENHRCQDLLVIQGAPPHPAPTVHRHDTDEVRYVLSGRGYFGFIYADGAQVLLEVGTSDYLNIPAGAEHWFSLAPGAPFKALRCFSRQRGGATRYTGRPIDPALRLPLAPEAEAQAAHPVPAGLPEFHAAPAGPPWAPLPL